MSVKFQLDADKPPVLSDGERLRLDAMTERDIMRGALSDPDNPPLTDAELGRITAARTVREVRARSGLSQGRFASAYRINLSRLRDLEQGRTRADSAFLAYLAVIDHDPETVKRALG